MELKRMAPLPDPIDLTRRLVGFETINPPGDEEACALFVGGLLELEGFDVRYHRMAPRRTSVVARRGGATGARAELPPICLTGHLDTVPLGAAPWSHDPLGGAIVGDKLYGRGSSDMKAGVAAMIVAALRSKEALDAGPGAILVFTAGEETGCDGARHLSDLPGALGAAGAIVVGEPTSNAPRIGHKGVLWLEAEARGVTAHGSMPELGVNAVYRAARLVGRLEDFGFNVAPHPALGSPSLNVGTFAGGSNINSVPDRAAIGIDIRTVPGMEHRHLAETLRGTLGSELAALETRLDLAPVWTEPGDPWITSAMAIAESITGSTADPAGAPYFTDASILKKAYGGAPTLVLGPGEQSLAHKTDEYCYVQRIGEAADIYARLLADWQSNAGRYRG
jgi:succinyl-diaminopimelate desuccinylase